MYGGRTAALDVQDQVSCLGLGTADLESYTIRISSGRHNKVIFQLTIIAMKHQVDAGIHVFRPHQRIARNACVSLMRIVSDHIIHFAGQFVNAD
jgi:hypothetical protein